MSYYYSEELFKWQQDAPPQPTSERSDSTPHSDFWSPSPRGFESTALTPCSTVFTPLPDSQLLGPEAKAENGARCSTFDFHSSSSKKTPSLYHTPRILSSTKTTQIEELTAWVEHLLLVRKLYVAREKQKHGTQTNKKRLRPKRPPIWSDPFGRTWLEALEDVERGKYDVARATQKVEMKETSGLGCI
ncbi:hypothetical protein T439DRAFT_349261 [Meredithblackwellia eburnea MCA 4105]